MGGRAGLELDGPGEGGTGIRLGCVGLELVSSKDRRWGLGREAESGSRRFLFLPSFSFFPYILGSTDLLAGRRREEGIDGL